MNRKSRAPAGGAWCLRRNDALVRGRPIGIDGELLAGRDIVGRRIGYPSVSCGHAKLELLPDGRLHVTDLDST